MHISVEANDDTIDTLALKIGRLFDDNAGLTHREILTALLNLISTTLVSIECRAAARSQHNALAMSCNRSLTTHSHTQPNMTTMYRHPANIFTNPNPEGDTQCPITSPALSLANPTTDEPTTPTPPQFNIESLRLSQDFEQSLGVKRLITDVPVRKPHKQEWVRVHPDAAYRGNFSVIL